MYIVKDDDFKFCDKCELAIEKVKTTLKPWIVIQMDDRARYPSYNALTHSGPTVVPMETFVFETEAEAMEFWKAKTDFVRHAGNCGVFFRLPKRRF